MHPQSRTCFIFPDGDGGWVVKMTMPDNRPLEFPLDLQNAARLQGELARAITDFVKPQAGQAGPAA